MAAVYKVDHNISPSERTKLKKIKIKKVIARRRSGNLRSNGTQAEEDGDPCGIAPNVANVTNDNPNR
ncbi:hypothetical protein ACN38_g1793 [Penicillium nordicum]|uniref:Uncharacterized protein n=1 Tax=Penicillium nordicum TaxID=229535 RepID=A0A0M8P8F3_9EURO|nr:hypothetical protein ACN38_g1793 [Penicillium nordicum]